MAQEHSSDADVSGTDVVRGGDAVTLPEEFNGMSQSKISRRVTTTYVNKNGTAFLFAGDAKDIQTVSRHEQNQRRMESKVRQYTKDFLEHGYVQEACGPIILQLCDGGRYWSLGGATRIEAMYRSAASQPQNENVVHLKEVGLEVWLVKQDTPSPIIRWICDTQNKWHLGCGTTLPEYMRAAGEAHADKMR